MRGLFLYYIVMHRFARRLPVACEAENLCWHRLSDVARLPVWEGPGRLQQGLRRIHSLLPSQKSGRCRDSPEHGNGCGGAQATPPCRHGACPCGTDGRSLTSPRSVASMMKLL